jgi:uncharacterized protein (TIGR02266 family)
MTPHHHRDSQGTATSGTSVASDVAQRPDRRQGERRGRRLSVKLFSAQTGDPLSYVGLTENLSEKGAFVATRAPWPIGSPVEVTIALSQQDFFHARARVRWHRWASNEGGTAPGIGIRFERLSAEEANRIREFVSRTLTTSKSSRL